MKHTFSLEEYRLLEKSNTTDISNPQGNHWVTLAITKVAKSTWANLKKLNVKSILSQKSKSADKQSLKKEFDQLASILILFYGDDVLQSKAAGSNQDNYFFQKFYGKAFDKLFDTSEPFKFYVEIGKAEKDAFSALNLTEETCVNYKDWEKVNFLDLDVGHCPVVATLKGGKKIVLSINAFFDPRVILNQNLGILRSCAKPNYIGDNYQYLTKVANEFGDFLVNAGDKGEDWQNKLAKVVSNVKLDDKTTKDFSMYNYV